jgi:myo-inositol-1(or 4)-monophosphatase
VREASGQELEAVALALAHAGGEVIADALGRDFAVEYKQAARPGSAPTDPVSQIDREVEELVRARLRERFPGHEVIGEESDEPPATAAPEVAWVVDPVDGTSNFVNTFPLFACSIGVVRKGAPVAGAIWCSTSHALRPGVYHAHRGGGLGFDGAPLERPDRSEHVKRPLLGDPGGAPRRTPFGDRRVTGSAALECAFVAAGILDATLFWRPRLWDVAAGVALVAAAGEAALVRTDDEWTPLERFEAEPTLRDWCQPLLLGRRATLDAMAASPRGGSTGGRR